MFEPSELRLASPRLFQKYFDLCQGRIVGPENLHFRVQRGVFVGGLSETSVDLFRFPTRHPLIGKIRDRFLYD